MSLFKGKKKPAKGTQQPGTISEEKMNEVEITVHAMPERFRNKQNHVNKAKNTGVLVLVFGVIFLIAMGFLFYYYIFQSNPQTAATTETPVENTKKAQTQNTEAVVEEKKEEPAVAENNEAVVEEKVEEIKTVNIKPKVATTTATSTEEEVVTEEPVVVMKFQPAPDSDVDGLSDAEELLIGSNTKQADSDADGYSDLSELLNMYNPSGAGSLEDNDNFSKYTNTTFSYQLIRPSNWNISKFGGDDSIMFEAVNGQFLQVIIQPNSSKMSIEDWYKSQFNKTEIDPAKIVEKSTWTGIYSDDGLTLFLTDKEMDHIITLTYNIGVTDKLFYKNLFTVVVNSFVIN